MNPLQVFVKDRASSESLGTHSARKVPLAKLCATVDIGERGDHRCKVRCKESQRSQIMRQESINFDACSTPE